MAIFNALDTGPNSLNQGPSAGQQTSGLVVAGSRVLTVAQGSKPQQRRTTINVQAPFAVGGAAAGSRQAVRYVVQQLREMANNADMQPIFIQWESGNGVIVPNAYDGWYILEEVTPQDFRFNTFVPCQVTATFVAPPAPRSMAMAYAGGALASSASGAVINEVGLPVGTYNEVVGGVTRQAGEGAVTAVSNPAPNPLPIVLSTTIASIFKGAVHVYDTLNTGSNPVPTAGGAFVHANWVEVFGTDHAFIGDCVVTNGLLLLLFVVGSTDITVYVWNTALAPATWQRAGILTQRDNALAQATVRSLGLVRVGMEECALSLISSGANGTVGQCTIRLQRGRYDGRADFKSLTQANTGAYLFSFSFVTPYKVAYNGAAITDVAVAGTDLAVQADYLYAAGFIASASFPFIGGLLWQNPPATAQPHIVTGTSDLPSSDGSGPALLATRSYGFFVVPFGISGVYSTANLQAEGESGALGIGWSSQADAAASGGNTARAVAGTGSGNADLFGTAFIAGDQSEIYDVWFRVRVTSAAGAVGEMKLGIWYVGGAVFVASTIFAANQAATGYVWLRAATNWNPNSFSNTYRFRAETAATLGTDWFIDEAVMVPKIRSMDNAGPQDLWSRFMFDRDVEMIAL